MVAEIIAKSIVYGMCALMCGIPAGLIMTIFYWLVRNLFYLPHAQEKVVEKAIKNKRIVTATLSEIKYLDNGAEKGIYTYECNGKTRTYTMISEIGFEERIQLYYMKNPKKAAQPPRVGVKEMPWVKCYFGTKTFVVVLVIILLLICIEPYVARSL